MCIENVGRAGTVRATVAVGCCIKAKIRFCAEFVIFYGVWRSRDNFIQQGDTRVLDWWVFPWRIEIHVRRNSTYRILLCSFSDIAIARIRTYILNLLVDSFTVVVVVRTCVMLYLRNECQIWYEQGSQSRFLHLFRCPRIYVQFPRIYRSILVSFVSFSNQQSTKFNASLKLILECNCFAEVSSVFSFFLLKSFFVVSWA